MAKSVEKKIFLAIDGGATKSRSVLLDQGGKILGKAISTACNAVLLSEEELRLVFKQHLSALKLKKNSKLELTSICLAGVINEKAQRKVKKAFSGLLQSKHIQISSDLSSALFAGHGRAEGIVAISGTGSCVYALKNNKSAKAGGWGHVMGDVGSGYHIAHQGLRRAVADYDLYGKLDILAKSILSYAKVKSIEELSVFVSSSSKAELAKLSRAVFDAYRKGHLSSRLILKTSAQALAANVLAVRRKIKNNDLPVAVAGGIFEVQQEYFDIFSEKLKIHWPDVKIQRPLYEASIGAHLWGCYKSGIDFDLSKLPKLSPHKAARKKLSPSLEKLEQSLTIRPVDEATIPTERRNPYTTELSELSIEDAVTLFIEQDAQLSKVLLEAKEQISHAVHLIVDAFHEGGRLFYLGAGTSGRLGVLDASECPPTFSVSEGKVQGIIAGGMQALSQAVEGAEDDVQAAPRELGRRDLSKHDIVIGIAASGRTPFVLSGIEYAKKRKARTVFLTCNPLLRERSGLDAECEIHLNSGPESLTGSTRLRSGTLCKMTLNIFTTLAMTKLGKVQSNYMIDVAASNDKLKVRAIGLVMTLAKVQKDIAYKTLVEHNWNVRLALAGLDERAN